MVYVIIYLEKSTRRDTMKRKAAEEDVEAKRMKKDNKQDSDIMHQRLEEWKVLTAFGARHQWQLIETELTQKKALLRGTHKVMMSTEGKTDLLKSLEKLYEDVEQLEMKLKKAKREEEDKPATSSSSKF